MCVCVCVCVCVCAGSEELLAVESAQCGWPRGGRGWSGGGEQETARERGSRSHWKRLATHPQAEEGVFDKVVHHSGRVSE